MAVNLTPGFDLQPSAQQVPVSTNYITNFDFLNQYLPDTYEKDMGIEQSHHSLEWLVLKCLPILTLLNGQNKGDYM